MGCLLIKEAMFANCILFATFCSMGTLVRRRKTWRYRAQKVMTFSLLMADITVYVSCKFEIYIFKTALVINKNVSIAFLFVLSIHTCIFVGFLMVLFFYHVVSFLAHCQSSLTTLILSIYVLSLVNIRYS